MYYVYKFLNVKDEVIYVGKTKNIFNRLSTHYSEHSHISDDCYVETRKVLFCKVSSEDYAKEIEHYLITFYKPRFNQQLTDLEYNLNKVPFLDFSEINAERLFKLHSRKTERIYNKLKTDLNALNACIMYHKERYPDFNKIKFTIRRKVKAFHGVEENETYEISPTEEHFKIIFKYLSYLEFKQIKVKYDIWEGDGRFAMRLQDMGEVVNEVRPLEDVVFIKIGTGYIQLKYTSIQEIELFLGQLGFYGREFSVRLW